MTSRVKALFFVSLFLFSLKCLAGFDLSAGAFVRSYPIAVTGLAEGAFTQYLWGNEKTLLNGFIRPSLQFHSSILSNGGNAEVEVAPINLLVLSAGASLSQLNSNLPEFNCSVLNCQGRVNREFVGIELMMGYDVWAITGKWVHTTTHYQLPDGQPWVDSYIYLIFHHPQGQFDTLVTRLVYRDEAKPYVFGIMNSLAWNGELAPVAQDAQYVFGRYKWKNDSVTLGLGRFGSVELSPGFSSFAYYSHQY